MGYRCPRCHKDFGKNKEAFEEHLYRNPYCHVDADFCVLPYKKHPHYVNRLNVKKNHDISNVSDKHIWRKTNLVSYPDGHDIMICTKCGCKVKRYGSKLVFDWRQKNKIINCKDK